MSTAHLVNDADAFVETRAGGLFFLNAVLAGPALLVLWPIVLGGALRMLGFIEGPSRIFDPIPEFAAQVGPYVAWASALPLWSTIVNLRMPLPQPARWTLRGLAALHVGVLVWWALTVLGI